MWRNAVPGNTSSTSQVHHVAQATHGRATQVMLRAFAGRRTMTRTGQFPFQLTQRRQQRIARLPRNSAQPKPIAMNSTLPIASSTPSVAVSTSRMPNGVSSPRWRSVKTDNALTPPAVDDVPVIAHRLQPAVRYQAADRHRGILRRQAIRCGARQRWDRRVPSRAPASHTSLHAWASELRTSR
jgi:hypothetical protein